MVKGGVILVAALLDVLRTRADAGADCDDGAPRRLEAPLEGVLRRPCRRGLHARRAREGRILGLIGENGAGKSTLMNMIGGVVPPTLGRMLWRGAALRPGATPPRRPRAAIAFIHQELNLFTNLTIAENLFIDGFPKRFGLIDRRAIQPPDRRAPARLSTSTAPRTPVEDLSPGERQLVEIAKALHRDAELIIFDEPTTSLTPRETERLFEMIAALRAEGQDDHLHHPHPRRRAPALRRHRRPARRAARRPGPGGRLRRRPA